MALPLLGLLLAYTCILLMYQLEALSGFAQGSALDLSQNGIGHFGIPRQHIRLNHVSTLIVGCRGDRGSGRSSNINKYMGRPSKNTVKSRVWHTPPLNLGGESSLPDLGGMGLQGPLLASR